MPSTEWLWRASHMHEEQDAGRTTEDDVRRNVRSATKLSNWLVVYDKPEMVLLYSKTGGYFYLYWPKT